MVMNGKEHQGVSAQYIDLIECNPSAKPARKMDAHNQDSSHLNEEESVSNGHRPSEQDTAEVVPEDFSQQSDKSKHGIMDEEERSPQDSMNSQICVNEESCASTTQKFNCSNETLSPDSIISSHHICRDASERSFRTESDPSTNWKMDDDFDDMSVASGHSYATYDTNTTSESVQDIISRLQSETDRRRRRLLRRRQIRGYGNRKSTDKLQKYNTSSSSFVDPKLGLTVEIKERL